MQRRIVPVKTAEGHDELATRARRLSQRHRTLLLVDGRRRLGDVFALARRAGVPGSVYRELLDLWLIAEPAGALDADAPMQAGEHVEASPLTQRPLVGERSPVTGGGDGSHRSAAAVVRAAFAPPSQQMPLLDTNPAPLSLMPQSRRRTAIGTDTGLADEIRADSAAAAELSREHVGLP